MNREDSYGACLIGISASLAGRHYLVRPGRIHYFETDFKLLSPGNRQAAADDTITLNSYAKDHTNIGSDEKGAVYNHTPATSRNVLYDRQTLGALPFNHCGQMNMFALLQPIEFRGHELEIPPV
jgi:hypothetical protein